MLTRNRYLPFPQVNELDRENGLEVALFFPLMSVKKNGP